MVDLFEEKAKGWDTRPIAAQLTDGVFHALQAAVTFAPEQTVMDFGAGTGLLATRLAPQVRRILAVDISQAMLDLLAKKPEAQGKITAYCQDIIEAPLPERADLIVSAMAMHHVQDTAALMRAFYDHLTPGGSVALADLDTERGDFHAPGTEGVFHDGFDRDALAALMIEAGFQHPRFVTACHVDRNAKRYPIFLVTATRP